MSLILSMVGFSLVFIIIYIIDNKLYSSHLSPTIILSFPFLIVIMISTIFSNAYGFVDLSYKVIIIWIFGVFIFWITGILSLLVFNRFSLPILKNKYTIYKLRKDFEQVWILLSLIILTLYLLLWFNSFRKVGFEVDSSDYNLDHGLAGHLLVILKFFLIYYIISLYNTWKPFKVIFIFITLAALILSQSKTGLFMPIISGLFGLYFIYDIKIRPKTIMVLSIIALIGFWSIYSISFQRFANMNFIFSHLYGYLNAGILSFSEYITANKIQELNTDFLYQPLVNIGHKLNGEPAEEVISNLKMKISPHFNSNVKTFFGSIFIYAGYIKGSLTVIFISLYTHLTYIFAVKTRSVILITYFFFLLGQLFFGWFDIYFNALSFYELGLFAVAMFFIERILIYRGKVVIN